MYFTLGPDGEPVPAPDMQSWASWLEAADKRRIVSKTQVGDAEVSTVFLGLNHQFGSNGLPMVFETMIFGGPWDDHQWRYTLRTEAQQGHDAIVAALQAGAVPDPSYVEKIFDKIDADADAITDAEVDEALRRILGTS